MPNDGERIAANYERILALRQELREVKREQERTRKRLHDLEGISSRLVDLEKARREHAAEQQQAFKNRITVLTVVVAIAALAEPFLYHAAGVG